MTHQLTRPDVQAIALLARLQLSDQQLDLLTSQLQDIVAYVDQLGQLDTDDAPPMAHPFELTNVFADDHPGPPLERHDALRNAPKHDDECFLVPAVLGD